MSDSQANKAEIDALERRLAELRQQEAVRVHVAHQEDQEKGDYVTSRGRRVHKWDWTWWYG